MEINLKKVNNIYTSPFFLIDYSQNHKKSKQNESVYRIWEQFDSNNVPTLNNQACSNSDIKALPR